MINKKLSYKYNMGVFNCVFVIIGVIIGAGFASGKEIYSFFFVYGKYGIFGACLSIAIIGLGIYKTLRIIKKYDINHYDEFLDIVFGNFNTKNIDIKIIINFIINSFLFISFFIMCAAIGAYFKQEFDINLWISCTAFSTFCYLVLNRSIKGIVLLNMVLMPIIIIILLVLGIKTFDANLEFEHVTANSIWVAKAIFYASYNSITLVSILIPLKGYIKKKSDIAKISIICMLIIALLSAVIFILLFSIDGDISKIELPTVFAIKRFGIVYKYLYGAIICGAITTTAISSAYAFLNNVSSNKRKYKRNNLVICVLGIFISRLGFSNLVNSLYPAFGILGLIQLVLIFYERLGTFAKCSK